LQKQVNLLISYHNIGSFEAITRFHLVSFPSVL
jgi:hypothetical protein